MGNDDICDIINTISVTKDKYTEIRSKTQAELAALNDVIIAGWPDTRGQTPIEVRQFWNSRDQLSVADGVIYKGLRIVIPPSLREQMLKLSHESHQGIVKCKQRAREVMYWPGMNSDIEAKIQNCSKCAEVQNQQVSEPLKPTPTPDLPYSVVGSDIFDFESKKYLLMVDYYSKYVDVIQLTTSTTTAVTKAMKSIFATHSIPQRLGTDNGPQYSSMEFKQFCEKLGIEHETSSPHFQSSNGEAERAIQTVKRLWKKADDKDLVLLDYRTTPMEGINLSPAQLLMGRRPRNTLPASSELLKPTVHKPQTVKSHFDKENKSQKQYYDRRRGVKELSPLNPGDNVRMSPFPGSKTWTPATVAYHYGKPRSYVVRSGDRLYRRNRKHLRLSTETANRQDQLVELRDPTDQETYQPGMRSPVVRNQHAPSPEYDNREPARYKTRSGRVVIPPRRLDLYCMCYRAE